jgi:hypothetical protein
MSVVCDRDGGDLTRTHRLVFTTRGWVERRRAGRKALVTATTPKTFVS